MKVNKEPRHCVPRLLERDYMAPKRLSRRAQVLRLAVSCGFRNANSASALLSRALDQNRKRGSVLNDIPNSIMCYGLSKRFAERPKQRRGRRPVKE